MERKVTKFGNSLRLTMTDALKKLIRLLLPDGISDDFMKSLAEVIEEYDQTLKGFQNR